ncbi:hypothetical protein [Thalassotalea ganghwensis]
MLGFTATGKYTQPAPQVNQVIQKDKAALVFLRASSFDGAMTSSLVQVNEQGESTLVGILGPKEKMIRYVEPGEHTFMVVGESADFMKANVEAGKVYYSIIRPRIGMWKSRFSLTLFKVQPEHEDFNINGTNLAKWLNECQYTQPNPQAFTWHKSKANEMKSLYNEYMPVWQNKTNAQRQAVTSTSEDGKESAL